MLYVFGIKEKEMHPNIKEIHDIQALRLENAKLRKLVQSMYEATLVSCGECWLSGSNPAECDNENCGNRKDYLAMLELGIEVEDD